MDISYLKTVKLWNNTDLQNALDYLDEDPKRKALFLLTVREKYSSRDAEAIKYCVDCGWYEAFDRFDSDVCETFIREFEKLFL